jgi:hypothetical protein
MLIGRNGANRRFFLLKSSQISRFSGLSRYLCTASGRRKRLLPAFADRLLSLSKALSAACGFHKIFTKSASFSGKAVDSAPFCWYNSHNETCALSAQEGRSYG